jgi:hypothetical protein
MDEFFLRLFTKQFSASPWLWPILGICFLNVLCFIRAFFIPGHAALSANTDPPDTEIAYGPIDRFWTINRLSALSILLISFVGLG